MIITVDQDARFGDRVATALAGSRWAGDVRHVAVLTDAIDLLRGAAAVQAMIIGPGVALTDAVMLTDHAAAMKLPPSVVIVAPPTTDTLRTAMRAGARDVLSPSFDDEELVDVLTGAGVSGSGPAPLPGLTVVVFSSKGGVGGSVVASNLAVLLAGRSGEPVTLLDLDLASADQAIMHGISAQWTIQDLVDGEIGHDHESLRHVLQPIGQSGARLLPGPVDPALAETITAPNVAEVIALTRSEAPFVVMDTSSSFDDRTLAAIDAADVLVLVTSMDVGALRALTVSLQTLQRLGVSCPIRICVTRADSRAGLNVGDIERTIGRSVDIRIPSHRAVPRSLNEGTPLALTTNRSGVVQAIDDLARDLLALAPPSLPGAVVGSVDDDRHGLRRRSATDDDGARNAGGADTTRPAISPEPAGPAASTGSTASVPAGARIVVRRKDPKAPTVPNDEPDGADDALFEDEPDSGSSGPDLTLLPPPVWPDDDDDTHESHRRRRTRRR